MRTSFIQTNHDHHKHNSFKVNSNTTKIDNHLLLLYFSSGERSKTVVAMMRCEMRLDHSLYEWWWWQSFNRLLVCIAKSDGWLDGQSAVCINIFLLLSLSSSWSFVWFVYLLRCWRWNWKKARARKQKTEIRSSNSEFHAMLIFIVLFVNRIVQCWVLSVEC